MESPKLLFVGPWTGNIDGKVDFAKGFVIFAGVREPISEPCKGVRKLRRQLIRPTEVLETDVIALKTHESFAASQFQLLCGS
jgi:hypothetical protein